MDKSLDGFHHIRNAEDRDQSPEVVREDMQAHLRLDALQAPGQKVRCAHPSFDGSVGMFNRAAASPHCIGRLFETCLHILKHLLMLPTGHAPVRTRRALFFKRTVLAIRAPVSVIRHAFFNGRKAPDERLTCRAAVFIFLRIINEVGLVESPVCFSI